MLIEYCVVHPEIKLVILNRTRAARSFDEITRSQTKVYSTQFNYHYLLPLYYKFV